MCTLHVFTYRSTPFPVFGALAEAPLEHFSTSSEVWRLHRLPPREDALSKNNTANFHSVEDTEEKPT